MRSYYYANYIHSGGETWRVYQVWFWQTIVQKINQTMSELENDGISNIKLEKIERV